MKHYREWLEEGFVPIGGGALESNINGIWFAKQSGKGSPVTFTTGTKRGRWVGGDFQINRADGSEAWSDTTLFADSVDFVNTLTGAGAPVLQGQSSLVAYLSWLACGQETVTGGVDAVVTLTSTGTPTGGTFTLTWTILGNVYTTAGIAFNASGATILAAIQAVLPAYYASTNIVASATTLPTAVTLTFSGTNTAKQPVTLPTADSTGLTGGSSPAITPTMSTAGTGYTHVATPADTGGFWLGAVKSVGKSVVHRSQFNDCKIQSLRIEGSSASKVVKITPTLTSLDPGQTISADPSVTDDGLRPFIYTEAAGAINIDGTIYRGSSSFAAIFTWGLNDYYGDDVTVYDLVNNTATAMLEGVTLLIDAAGLLRYNSQIYGTTTPSVGSKPIHTVPLLGSYQITFSRTNPATGQVSESLKVEFPGVKWDPSLAIPANPAGGAVELSFAGAMRKVVGGTFPFKITTKNNLDPAFSS